MRIWLDDRAVESAIFACSFPVYDRLSGAQVSDAWATGQVPADRQNGQKGLLLNQKAPKGVIV